MKLRQHELQIPKENPFTHCKLQREPYAKVLTNIAANFADGFVLAINNEWGAGKTTFVKMWQEQLKVEKFKTIYFNAWENDFDNNPLVALMSELQSLTNENNKKLFRSVLEKASVLFQNIAPALAKSLLKKHLIDVDEIAADASENITKAATEILQQELKTYASKKKTIVEFRDELEKYVNLSVDSKPLIFIIDELDRCRPNYAVEVLEQIKHFFSVPGIVFVLSIDKKQLSSSIKGFYGSEQIDSTEYLRRFIDVEYSLPPPNTKAYNEYLFNYYGFASFFDTPARRNVPSLLMEAKTMLNIVEVLFANTPTTLRQQERIFAVTRLVLCSFKHDHYTFSYLLFILVYYKLLHAETFQKIASNDLSHQELSDFFAATVYMKQTHYDLNLIYLEALLHVFYNNNKEHRKREELLVNGEFDTYITPIKSKLEATNARTTIAKEIVSIRREGNFHSVKLDYLLNKINLTEDVII